MRGVFVSQAGRIIGCDTECLKMNDDLGSKGGCLGIVLSLLGIKPGEITLPPFRLRDDFLSPVELSFYGVLTSVVNGQAVICPKVNLGDIFFVSAGDQSQAQRNRISRKHVDFLLCANRTMKPLGGIELDDSSHSRSDRKERDALVDQVFASAGLQLIHFPAKRGYVVDEVTERVRRLLQIQQPVSQPTVTEVPAIPTPESSYMPPVAAALSVPTCPKCGISMVLRTGTKGQFQGKQFYGCANYPKCREILPG